MEDEKTGNILLDELSVEIPDHRVKEAVDLFAAMDTDVLIGKMASFYVAVLLLWEVLASLPVAS